MVLIGADMVCDGWTARQIFAEMMASPEVRFMPGKDKANSREGRP
ncbi:hypothetical protein [Sphingobium sp. EM0848]|nr:hypothetical protein [Sphingobium sp. EM0848]